MVFVLMIILISTQFLHIPTKTVQYKNDYIIKVKKIHKYYFPIYKKNFNIAV